MATVDFANHAMSALPLHHLFELNSLRLQLIGSLRALLSPPSDLEQEAVKEVDHVAGEVHRSLLPRHIFQLRVVPSVLLGVRRLGGGELATTPQRPRDEGQVADAARRVAKIGP